MVTGGRDLETLATREEVGEGELAMIFSMPILIVSFSFASRVVQSNARAQRFIEEEDLVLEEMRRSQRYFAWKSSWWLNGRGLTSNHHHLHVSHALIGWGTE